jgi:hypothetical protein
MYIFKREFFNSIHSLHKFLSYFLLCLHGAYSAMRGQKLIQEVVVARLRKKYK